MAGRHQCLKLQWDNADTRAYIADIRAIAASYDAEKESRARYEARSREMRAAIEAYIECAEVVK